MESFNYVAPGTKHLGSGADFVPTIHNDTYEFIKPEQHDLKDRAVLITGASKGIGRATALSFARAGASKIAVAARSSLQSLEQDIAQAAKQAGRPEPKVVSLVMDVADFASVDAGAKEVEKAFGRLDIIINNAGYLEPFVPMLDSKPEDWTRTYQINVFGVYHVTRAFLPLQLKTTDGLKTIINLSSIGAHVTAIGGSSYQSGKLAVSRFSEFIGVEYPEALSFSIHPGGVLTELAKGMGEHMEHLLIDTPELAADAMVWLSAERRDWLQGRYVSVTWDMQKLLEKRSKIEQEDLLKVKLRVD